MSDQVRHAVSDGSCAAHVLLMCRPRTGPYAIQNSEFGILKSGTRGARAWSGIPRAWSGRSDLFHPSTFLLDD
jgi:hypothetical protein